MKEIWLTKGLVALVDDHDYDNLVHPRWCAFHTNGHWYAKRKKWNGHRYLHQYMHRLILDAPKGMDVDHINGNGLDNRRENLRICTHSENMMNMKAHRLNTSHFRGVTFDKSRKLWVTHASLNGKTIGLGRHATPEEAARAYDLFVKRYFPLFGHLNFP